jgi:ABC-type spermidine/putrescine transport system permease subunit I
LTRALITAQIVLLSALLVFVLLVAMSSVEGYDFRFLQFGSGQWLHLPKASLGPIITSLAWGGTVAALAALLSFLYVGLCYYTELEFLVAVGIATLLLSSPATRAASLSILYGQVQLPSWPRGAGLNLLGSALQSALATVMPFMLAAITLAVRRSLPRYLQVHANLGGNFRQALRDVMLPMARPALVAAFLLGFPLAVFDPYSLRIAGGQVLPSVGALLVDLESVSDWPGIATVCLMCLLVIVPVFLVALPFARGRA